jgi:ankyrin repeat protein
MGAKPSIVKAAGRGDIARVQHLVRKRGKGVLLQKAPGGWTAMHKAARNGRLDVVMFLVESNADLDAMDASMSTPLHCACWKVWARV